MWSRFRGQLSGDVSCPERTTGLSPGFNPGNTPQKRPALTRRFVLVVADRLRVPFAGLAFASVVSLIPGSYLFQMARGMAILLTVGPKAGLELSFQIIADGRAAILIVVAMTFGLVIPRICLYNVSQSFLPRGSRNESR